MTSSPLEVWGLTTPEMAKLFSADSIVGAMLVFEKNLALALAEAGLAPEESAKAIAAVCDSIAVDAVEILATTWPTGTPVIRLVEEIRNNLEDENGKWVHHGSTTQDVIDTAHMLLASQALGELDGSLRRVARALRDLILSNRDQPQMGRTFLQHARPTTFAMRAAGWLEPTLRHILGLRAARDELAIQLGGPVGDRSAYGGKATAVARALAQLLELEASDIAWHTDRSRVRRLSSSVSGVAATMAKIAMDVALLAQTEVAEVSTRAGGSSSIEGKQNPIDAVRALAAADVVSGVASILERARPHELDRGLGSLHAEWVALPLLFQATSASVEATASCIESLEVDREHMAESAGPQPAEAQEATDQGQIDAVLERYQIVSERA